MSVGYSISADGDGVPVIAVTGRCIACGRLGYRLAGQCSALQGGRSCGSTHDRDVNAAKNVSADDGVTPTDSVHIVDLPEIAAARGAPSTSPTTTFLAAGVVATAIWCSVSARGRPPISPRRPAGWLGLITYGPMLCGDGVTWLATAALARAADPDEARALLTSDRYAEIEVRDWAFGGWPS